jgi:hypothetical protein
VCEHAVDRGWAYERRPARPEAAQRIRFRHTYVRGEQSTAGTSDLSTRRSVPMADRLVGELDAWSRRADGTGEPDLVFAHHPHTGRPIDPG